MSMRGSISQLYCNYSHARIDVGRYAVRCIGPDDVLYIIFKAHLIVFLSSQRGSTTVDLRMSKAEYPRFAWLLEHRQLVGVFGTIDLIVEAFLSLVSGNMPLLG
jgi:hypothetical protein